MLSGKTALITGGGRGIGRAIALEFARNGARVAVAARTAEQVEEVAAEIGGDAVALVCDVSDPESVARMFGRLRERIGDADILVNNAGIAPENYIENVTEEDFDYTIDVNLKGMFFTTQAVGKLMIQQQSGTIVNLSSQAGFIALPTESVYCVTKAGIAHLTKCIAVEWAKYNITANAVAPTFINTPGTKEYLANEENKNQVLSKIKLGRIGEPKDVANAVLFLASPAASLITGTTLLVDGGWTAV